MKYTPEYFNNLMLEQSEDYMSEINDAINMHNMSVIMVTQHITTATILALLLKKGIITSEEYNNEFENSSLVNSELKQIEETREAILEVINQVDEAVNSMKMEYEAHQMSTDEIDVSNNPFIETEVGD